MSRCILLTAAILAAVAAPAQAQPSRVSHYDDIEDLKTFVPIGAPPHRTETVLVAGHSERFDGGGGVFLWDPSSTAAPDDGIVVQPTVVTDSGRWIRMRENPNLVSVLWYGARDDGSEPSVTAAAVEAAVSAVARGYATTLYFPRGVYAVDRSLTMTHLDLRIQGDGPDTSTLRTAEAFRGEVLLTINGDTNLLRMDALALYGRDASTSLRLEGKFHHLSTFTNLYLHGASQMQLDIAGYLGHASMDKVSLLGGRFGLHARAELLRGILIRGLRVTNTQHEAVHLESTGLGQPEISLYDPIIEGNRGPAIAARGGMTLRLFGGHFENNNRDDAGKLPVRGTIELAADPGRRVACKLDLFATRIGADRRFSMGTAAEGERALPVRVLSWPAVIALHGAILVHSQAEIRFEPEAVSAEDDLSAVWGTMLQLRNPCVTGFEGAEFWPDLPVPCSP